MNNKSSKWYLILALLFALATANTALGDSTPEETASEVVRKFKRNGSPSVILDYVHWPSAYNKLPPLQRQEMKLRSPQEYRRVYERNIRSGPGKSASFGKSLKNLPPTQRREFEKLLKEKRRSKSKEIRAANYSIGKARVQGNAAIVPLTTTLNGKKKESSFRLIRVGKKWLFSDIPQPDALVPK